MHRGKVIVQYGHGINRLGAPSRASGINIHRIGYGRFNNFRQALARRRAYPMLKLIVIAFGNMCRNSE